MKKISIVGSTGSIGVNTLDVIKNKQDRFQICGLAAKSNVNLLERQIRTFKPEAVSLDDPQMAQQLASRVNDLPVKVYAGSEGTSKIATLPGAEIIVSAAVGIAGLIPSFLALEAGKIVALANKEVLVVAGELISKKFGNSGRILPLDSEHNAIFQLLIGEKKEGVEKIILTASGGPFLTWKMEDLVKVTPEEALRHPNWDMGQKITIDSATLMNKGFEVMVAKWLFDVKSENIKVLIHPQSIVHSIVEFIDGSMKALMSATDMRIPIAYALDYPERTHNTFPKLDLAGIGDLSFQDPDLTRFPCLELCYSALKTGGTMPVVLNASNEMMVQAFLERKITFTQIPEHIQTILNVHSVKPVDSLDEILRADKWARNECRKILTR